MLFHISNTLYEKMYIFKILFYIRYIMRKPLQVILLLAIIVLRFQL